MNQYDYIDILPKKPSDECFKYIEKRQKDNETHQIVFRMSRYRDPYTEDMEPAAKCTCTACGQTYLMPAYNDHKGNVGFYDDTIGPVRSFDACYCAECGVKAKAIHISSVPKTGRCFDGNYTCEFRKISTGEIALLCWYSCNTIYKDGRKELFLHPYDAYVFCDKKTFMYKAWYKYFSGFHWLDDYELKIKCIDDIGRLQKAEIFPVKQKIFNGTNLENAKIPEFIKGSDKNECCLLAYIRTYLAHPNVENFITAGMTKAVNKWITESKSPYYTRLTILGNQINWKARKPAAMLGINRNELSLVKNCSLQQIVYYSALREHGYIRPSDIEDFDRYPVGAYHGTALIEYGINPITAMKYVDKQNKKYKNTFTLNYYLDYLTMAKNAEIDTSLQTVKFPQYLQREHDRMLQLRREKENEAKIKEVRKKNSQFEKQSKHLTAYEYHKDGLFIRPAMLPEELIRESAALSHCVGYGGYMENHIAGNHYIFFIRKEDEPDTPYYTLNFNEKTMTVIQNRGKSNCKRTPEVQQFENEWLKFVKSQKTVKAG